MNDSLKAIMGNEKLDISNKFYENLNKEIGLQGSSTGNQLNLDWIDEISKALQYINNIYDSPRRFIIGEEEVLNIEKSKKVTVESIKHLAKHSNFISEFDEETNDVKPSKLLNVLKEETFNTYENRFAYTLVDLIESFVRRMEEKMDMLLLDKSERFFCNANSKVNNEDIKLQVKLVANREMSNKNLNEDYTQKIAAIKSAINSWKSSVLYVSLKKEGAAKVTNPLKRTNVLLKNPNFKVAAALWDFLYNYQENIDELNNKADNYSHLSPELQKIVDNSLLMYYIITKMGTAKTEYEQSEYRKYIKAAAVDMLSTTTEVLMDNFDISAPELTSFMSNKAVEYKNKKIMDTEAVVNKIETAIKKFTDKVDNSYFKAIGSDVSDKENIENDL